MAKNTKTKNITEDLLLLITENTNKLIEQTQTKDSRKNYQNQKNCKSHSRKR